MNNHVFQINNGLPPTSNNIQCKNNPDREASMGIMLNTGSPQWHISGEILSSVLKQVKARIDEVNALQSTASLSM